jgi:hypothetical protein
MTELDARLTGDFFWLNFNRKGRVPGRGACEFHREIRTLSRERRQHPQHRLTVNSHREPRAFLLLVSNKGCIRVRTCKEGLKLRNSLIALDLSGKFTE